MSDARWVRVTVCENVPPREGRAVIVGDRELALFNLGDRLAISDSYLAGITARKDFSLAQQPFHLLIAAGRKTFLLISRQQFFDIVGSCLADDLT